MGLTSRRRTMTNETTQQTIERLTKQLGEWADNPANVNGAVIEYHGGKWRLFDNYDSWEFSTVEKLEKGVADYIKAMEQV
jgi:hypothetical protein